MTPTTKQCKGPCGEDKPLDAYRRQASSPDGHTAYCKVCLRAADKRRRDKWKAPTPDEAYKEGFAAGVAGARKHLACLDDDTLKAAAALCHSDRHPPERHAEADRVTAVLLAARGKLR